MRAVRPSRRADARLDVRERSAQRGQFRLVGLNAPCQRLDGREDDAVRILQKVVVMVGGGGEMVVMVTVVVVFEPRPAWARYSETPSMEKETTIGVMNAPPATSPLRKARFVE